MNVKRIITILLTAGLAALTIAAYAYSPYATTLVSYSSDLTGSGLYNDPYAVLGQPSTMFYNTWGGAGNRRVKLVEPAYNVGPDGEKLITTINTGTSIVVEFDHQVMDDPLNPFGIDFLVFGNSFFAGSGGSVSESTNLNTFNIGGGIFAENTKVSVSQDGTNWYTYDSGPYADSMFPTNAYLWDSVNACWTDTESDYTKPVDPSLTNADFAGTAAHAIELYNGSAGGTGFDLTESGYSWIQYIKVEGVSGFAGGEIDGFSDVAAVPEPGSLVALLCGLIGMGGLAHRRRIS